MGMLWCREQRREGMQLCHPVPLTMSTCKNNHKITRTVPRADLLPAGVSLSHTGYLNSNEVTQAALRLCLLACLQGESSLNPKGTGVPSRSASLGR